MTSWVGENDRKKGEWRQKKWLQVLYCIKPVDFVPLNHCWIDQFVGNIYLRKYLLIMQHKPITCFKQDPWGEVFPWCIQYFQQLLWYQNWEKAPKICGLLWIGRAPSSLENEIRIRNESDKFMMQPHINNTKWRKAKALQRRKRNPKAEHEQWNNWLNCEKKISNRQLK